VVGMLATQRESFGGAFLWCALPCQSCPPKFVVSLTPATVNLGSSKNSGWFELADLLDFEGRIPDRSASSPALRRNVATVAPPDLRHVAYMYPVSVTGK
jgi:hypothetical protein